MKSSIQFIEAYFGSKLTPRSAAKISAKTSTREWVKFCRDYWINSEVDMRPAFNPKPSADEVRLYVEPRLKRSFDKTVSNKFGPSPLIGNSHYRITSDTPSAEEVAAMLNPLKKHLLTSDQIFLPDGLLSVLDFVGEDAKKYDVDRVLDHDVVPRTEQAIKKWLFVLAHLRPLLKDGSIVFFPYHQMPAFYAGANSEEFKHLKSELIFTSDEPVLVSSKEDEIFSSIFTARLFDLDAVLPDKHCFEYASHWGFVGEKKGSTRSVGQGIELGFDGLMPEDSVSVKDLVAIRKNEEVFSIVKTLSVDCKRYIEKNIPKTASPDVITRLSKAYIEDSLAEHGKSSVLKSVGDNTTKSTATSIIVAVCTLPLDFGAALIASLATNPTLLREAEKAADKTHKAHSRLLRLFP